MNKTRSTGNLDAVLLDRKTLLEYLNSGRVTAERIAKEAGAVRKFGKTVRFFRPAIDEYLANYQRNKEVSK